MKKLFTTLILGLGIYSQSTHAALIELGPYTIDESASVSSLLSANNIYSSNNSSSAITDLSLSTYLYGNPTNPDTGSATLGFNQTIYNGTNEDLVFYFIRGNQDAEIANFDLTIGNTTTTYNASLFTYIDGVSGETKKYQATINGVGFDILTALVNLDDFGLNLNDTISQFTIADINHDERFALAAGFHIDPTAVPLPAPLLLFISGIFGLAAFARRK